MRQEVKTEVIQLRATSTEAAALRRLADERKTKVSRYLRSLILDDLRGRGYLPLQDGGQNANA